MDAYPKTHLKAAIILTVAFIIIFTALPSREATMMKREPVSLEITAIDTAPVLQAAIEPVPAPIEAEPEPVVEETHWQTVTVRSGDNMSRIFQRAGLSARTLHDIMNLGPDVQRLRRIMPGEQLQIETRADGSLQQLRYEQSALRTLIIDRDGEGYIAQWEEVEPEVIVAFATADISTDAPSLYHAGKRAGLSDNIIMKLSYIFQWDISFALDLRQGDSFTVMYEEHYVRGEKVREGDIIAAHFSNMGTRYNAVAYEDATGRLQYYAPDGSSMRKAFLRDPVHFSHVSSQFNLKRLHPIHKHVMPHRGIDYAANTGTPVRASGDGKVTIARQNAASGKYIVIQHGEQYTTKYLHLSAFANGVRAGKRVNQGDVIGYVGSTGWATGPHLHYEFLVGGVHRNPRTVALPKSEPIPESKMAAFRAKTQPLLARLDSLAGQTGYAQAESNRGESSQGEG